MLLVLAVVAASVVLLGRLLGFAVVAMGGRPLPDANGGKIAVCAGLRGFVDIGAHFETQTQCCDSSFCQFGVASFLHEPWLLAPVRETSLSLRGGGIGLPLRALFS